MTFNLIRLVTFSAAALLSPVVLSAQDQATLSTQQRQPNNPATQDSGNNAKEMSQGVRDKMFLRRAAEEGLAEVKFGQLAAQRGDSEEVKAFGQKMVEDHTSLNEQMSSLADSLGVRLPKSISKEDQIEYDKLSELSGSAFDTEYLTLMMKNHRADLHAFRSVVETLEDVALEDAAVKAIKVIREHTMMADKLARARGIPVPARPASKPS